MVHSLPDMLFQTVNQFPEKDALRIRRHDQLYTLNYRQFGLAVRETAAGLASMGINRGDRVAILSDNRPEWTITDFAAFCVHAVVVPVYTTLPANQIAYILENAGVRIIFVDSPVQLEKVRQIRDQLPQLEFICTFEPLDAEFQDLEAIQEIGRERISRQPDFVEASIKEIAPDEICSILYTSGTTGPPKGVMLSHAGFLENIHGTIQRIRVESHYVFLSFLPLSHLYERLAGHWCAIQGGATIHYSRGIEHVVDDLAEAHPHVLISVPRLYEKVMARVHDTVQQSSLVKRKLFEWAFRNGDRYREILESGMPDWPLHFRQNIAEKLVFNKIRRRFGRNLCLPVSGGAPLSPETLRFFRTLGLFIHEGYGMTETHLIIALTPPGKMKPGSCGKPLDNIQVQIADDGEVLVKGPTLMKGYYQSAELTRDVIDDDGWLHTGDIGHFDQDGYLYLTDRKKNIIVTAGGKNVAPAPIEGAIKKSPYIEEICLVGDKRKFISALVVPDFDSLTARFEGNGVVFKNPTTMVSDQTVHDFLWSEVEKHQSEFARYEQVKKIAILPEPFTIERGELTPSLKVKRNVVETHYQTLIQALYSN